MWLRHFLKERSCIRQTKANAFASSSTPPRIRITTLPAAITQRCPPYTNTPLPTGAPSSSTVLRFYLFFGVLFCCFSSFGSAVKHMGSDVSSQLATLHRTWCALFFFSFETSSGGPLQYRDTMIYIPPLPHATQPHLSRRGVVLVRLAVLRVPT